jgi:hypothetical protein
MLSLGQASSANERDFALRVTFGRGRDRVVYEYIPFRVSRRGSKEVELTSGDKEPFRMILVIRDKDGDFTFTEKTSGFSVRSADKWIRAMRALSADPCIELYDLAAEKRLFDAGVTLDSDLGRLSKYEAFFRNFTEVSDHFGVELYLRRAVEQADVEAFMFLRRLMECGTLDVGPITGNIEKADDGGFPEEIWAGKPHALRLDHGGHPLTLLDTSIQTGPYSLTVDVRLQNPAAMYEKWQSAADGALIPFTWEPVGPARLAERVAAPVT